jgi:predicted ATPase/DNA-binding XRE family transcriptional regulator
LRVSAGLSRDALAEQAGLSPDAVAVLERGERASPRLSTVTSLADALNVEREVRADLLQAAGYGTRGAAPYVRREYRRQFPIPPSPLIGREADLARASRLLQPRMPETRVVTLLGPGGVGKTRLALEVAAHVAPHYRDGSVFVDLAPLTDPRLVAASIARTLGLQEVPGRSASDLLHLDLAPRQLLLVLDNFEHLLGAAPLLADLLADCAELKLLVTSRSALRLRVEHRCEVEPLQSADSGQSLATIAAAPAVQLFVQRARMVAPDFELSATSAQVVAAICSRLDGLPLAIELAAVGVRVLSPEALLHRLERRLPSLTGGAADLPERQRALRNTLEWSHDLLEPAARRLFRRLAVFRGGWTLNAAEAICGDAILPPESILELLQALADGSLIQIQVRRRDTTSGEPRFGMLDTIREYAADSLAQAGEVGALERAHAEHYLNLVESAAPHWPGPEQSVWTERLEDEHANLRTALEWARAGGAREIGLRLAGGLSTFWWLRGYYREGAAWLESLLATAPIGGIHPTPATRARALLGAGVLRTELGDRRAADHLEASVAILRTLDEPGLLARALHHLGVVRSLAGQLRQAETLLEEALTIVQPGTRPSSAAGPLLHLGVVAQWQGSFGSARARLEEGLRLSQVAQDQRAANFGTRNLACVAVELGAYDRAETLAKQAVEGARALGFPREELLAVLIWGRALRERGDTDRAIDLLERGNRMADALGYPLGPAFGHAVLGLAYHDRGDETAAACHAAAALAAVQDSAAMWPGLVAHLYCGQIALAQADWARAEVEFGTALEIGNVCETRWGRPACMEGLAAVALERQDAHRAAHLLGLATALRVSQGAPVPLVDRPRIEQFTQCVRQVLGQDEFERVLAAERSNPSFTMPGTGTTTSAMTTTAPRR